MRTIRRFLLVTLALTAWASLPGVPAQAATSYGVEIKDRAYDPERLLDLSIGDTVTWTNRDGEEHSVTFNDGIDSSPQCQRDLLGRATSCMGTGESFKRVFTATGTFQYHCKLHPSMTGSVEVKGVTGTSTQGSSTSTTAAAPSASSTTSTTAGVRATITTRAAPTAPAVPVSTTTTTGITYTPLERGQAPAFDPDKNEDTSPVPDPDEAAQQVAQQEDRAEAASRSKDDDDGGGGGGAAVLIIVLLIVVAGAGGAAAWKLRPRRAA